MTVNIHVQYDSRRLADKVGYIDHYDHIRELHQSLWTLSCMSEPMIHYHFMQINTTSFLLSTYSFM